jgi:hypothetical protein
MTEAVVIAKLLERPTGDVGTWIIVAPLPCSESLDSPYTFEVETVAKIESPKVKLYGVAYKVSSGIVHVSAPIMLDSVPSQYVSSSE